MNSSQTFFFAIAILCVSGFMSIAYAEEPISSVRFKDRQIDHYQDGRITETFGMVPYVQDGNNWVDRKISNNGTHFNVYSEMGSFSYSKTDCTITQYAKGFDPTTKTAHRYDIMIGDWFWTIARKDGANPWEVIDPTIFGCTINTFQNSTGKYLEMTRTHQPTGSYLKVTLVAPKDKPIEDFNELYMNVPGWSGNKFAFVLWAKDVNANSLTYRNGTTIQIPQGTTMIDRSQLTVESMDFVRNGNAFYFDWQKASDKFKTLLLNKTGTNLDVQFGFNSNPVTLSSGEKMYLDPTYGYTVGMHKSPFSVAGNCNTNGGGNIAGIVGTDGAANFCYYDSVEWDTSSIPDASTITDVRTRYDTQAGGGAGPITCNAVKLTSQPSTITNAALQAEIIGSGTTYASLGCTTGVATDTVVDLGATADADLQARLTSDWFAFGTIRSPNALAAIVYADFDTVELQVTYTFTAKPDSITTLQVDDFDTDSVDLSWTAPSLNGGTLQLYQMNYTTPCGIPLTNLPNGTAATSYIVSSLSPATCYSFRATAVTQNGGNVTFANIVNVTTLAFNQANFTIGDLSFDAENDDVIPIFFERDDISSTSLYLNVTYPDTWELACDFHYKFAMTNHTYSNLTFTTISADSIESSFLFSNVDREIINVFCWDQNGTGEGKYLITQSVFPLLTYIQKFDSGHYGTAGNFGSIDLVYLAVVIVSMVGLNRTNESVGAGFMIVITAAMAYFEFITIPTAAISGIGLAVMLIIISTRKD